MNILEMAIAAKMGGGGNSGGQGGVSSWNDLKDKPFGETVFTTDSYTLVSSTIDLETAVKDSLGMFFKVSDLTPTVDEMMVATVSFMGEVIPVSMGGEPIALDGITLYMGGALPVVTTAGVIADQEGTEVVFPEVGIYAVTQFHGATMYFPSLARESVTKLDNQYLNLEWLPVAANAWEEFIPTTTAVTNADLYEYDWTRAEDAEKFRVHLNPNSLTDSLTYECTPVNYQGMVTVIGNVSLLVGNQATDTGEPFVIAFGRLSDTYSVQIITGDIDLDSLAVEILVKKYNTIPEEFLPGADATIVPELGSSFRTDYTALKTLREQLDKNGSAVCRYNNTLYAVLGVSYDEGGSVLLAKATKVLPVIDESYALYVLRYDNPSSEPILLPILKDHALYLTSSSVDERGEESRRRFRITVDDNGVVSAIEAAM